MQEAFTRGDSRKGPRKGPIWVKTNNSALFIVGEMKLKNEQILDDVVKILREKFPQLRIIDNNPFYH
jgi:hypothetical protein